MTAVSGGWCAALLRLLGGIGADAPQFPSGIPNFVDQGDHRDRFASRLVGGRLRLGASAGQVATGPALEPPQAYLKKLGRVDRLVANACEQCSVQLAMRG
jgi:hypothetical protein